MEIQNKIFIERVIHSSNISKICLHPHQHKLLFSTSDSLQSFWIRDQLKFNMTSQIEISNQIQDMAYLINSRTNQDVAVFANLQSLYMVQQSKQQCLHCFNHNLEITHIKSDLSSINPDLVLTAALDLKIRLLEIPSSKYDNSLITEFTDNQYPITELFWKNSLMIIGDQAGYVNLTDINTKKIVHKQRVHYTPITNISPFTDFTFNNVYFTFAKDEKVLKFYDLRNNKLIMNITQLKVGDKFNKICNNSSGKVIIGNEELLDVIDIYSGYRSIGQFKCRDDQKKLQPIQNRVIKSRAGKIKTQEYKNNENTKPKKQVVIKIDQESNLITKYACKVGYTQKSPSIHKSIKIRDCKLTTSYNSTKKSNEKINFMEKKYFSDFCLHNSSVYAGDTNGNISILNLDFMEKTQSTGFGLYGSINNLCWAENALIGTDAKGDAYMATFCQKKKKINKQN